MLRGIDRGIWPTDGRRNGLVSGVSDFLSNVQPGFFWLALFFPHVFCVVLIVPLNPLTIPGYRTLFDVSFLIVEGIEFGWLQTTVFLLFYGRVK